MITKKTPQSEVIKAASDCRRCAACCTNTGCIVLGDEVGRIATRLGTVPKKLSEEYLVENEMFHTKIYKSRLTKAQKCVFLNSSTCMLQEAKPLHCKVATCEDHGSETLEWFYLNKLVDLEDPESIRQWASRLVDRPTIPGGSIEELVPDEKLREDILSYRIIRKEKDWGKVLGIKED